ncbi:MAG TPA: hypothetical protein PK095_00535 [Myxococcota bacterium]|nr:hypothetical protein [Myxococcota bacterium]
MIFDPDNPNCYGPNKLFSDRAAFDRAQAAIKKLGTESDPNSLAAMEKAKSQPPSTEASQDTSRQT